MKPMQDPSPKRSIEATTGYMRALKMVKKLRMVALPETISDRT